MGLLKPLASSRFTRKRRRLEWAFVIILVISAVLMVWLRLHTSLFTISSRHESDAQLACERRIEAFGLSDLVGNVARSRMYREFAREFRAKGLRIEGTQGVAMTGMFTKDAKGYPIPVRTPLEIPVRAILLRYTEPQVRKALRSSVTKHISPLVSEKGLWLQDDALYHSTLYHASTHQHPVPAGPGEVAAEAESLRNAARRLCPLRLLLARVVVNSAGAVVAAWQVGGGPEPAAVRQDLREALPGAPPPELQTIREPAIVHTTLARLLERPLGGSGEALLQAAVDRMTDELCGLAAHLGSIWFVQEHELLALALGGAHSDTELPLSCEGGGASN